MGTFCIITIHQVTGYTVELTQSHNPNAYKIGRMIKCVFVDIDVEVKAEAEDKAKAKAKAEAKAQITTRA